MIGITYLYLFIVVLLLSYITYVIISKSKSKEGFLSLDAVDTLPICLNMTPDSLLQAFDFDIDRLSAVLISLEINPNILRNKSLYPKLATLLIQRGLLQADKCK